MTQGTLPPRLQVLGRSWSSFHVCGLTGLALGTTLALALAVPAGLSPAVIVVLLASGLVTFLVLAMVHKVVTGREALVYYHHEIAIMTVAAGLLAALDLPVLPYLDVTAVGLGVFLAFGRCGCLMVGCCHGRPHSWGVRYGDAHAAEGFPSGYVGARLFPVQAVEALAVAAIVAAGAAAILGGRPAGTAWALYVVSYSIARIWLEELRGDGVRPYWLRLSEAQWTSLALIVAVVLGGWQARLPASPWHVAAAMAGVLSLVAIAARRSGSRALLQARHADEIAAILHDAPGDGSAIAVRRTSQALGVSTQALGPMAGGDAVLYSISRADRCLTPDEASAVARFIADVAAAGGARELIRGGRDVFHLIVRRPRPAPAGE